MTFHQRLAPVVCASLALVLAACTPPESDGEGSDDSGESRAPVTFTATEFAYEGPETIPGGMTEVVLENKGKEGHSLMFFRLDEGKTPDDFFASFEKVMTGEAPIPDWLSFPGGIAGIPGGQSASAVLDLEPGNFLVLSLEEAPGSDQVDAERGMVHMLTVTEPEGPAAEVPETDMTVSMNDFSFAPSANLKAGPQMIKFENKGKQPHEAVVMRLAEGVTADDFVEMASADEWPDGPPPVTAAGGGAPLDPGGTSYVSMDLEPGKYMVICYVPDPEGGMPHFAKGMVDEFTVE
jgi:plastocyanin